MKLYLHLVLFVALCALIVDIQSMQLSKAERYERYKSLIDERISSGASSVDLNGSFMIFNTLLRDDTLLNACAYDNFTDLVTILLNHMPIKEHQDDYNKALIVSTYKNNSTEEEMKDFSITKLLVERGANVNFLEKEKAHEQHPTALMGLIAGIFPTPGNNILFFNYIIPIVTFLLKHNANPNIQAKGGGTALIQIVQFEKMMSTVAFGIRYANYPHLVPTYEKIHEVVKLLIVSGGDLALQKETFRLLSTGATYSNINAVQIAQVSNKLELAEVMQTTAAARDRLIYKVQQGKDIDCIKTKGISRFHVKDINGNSLFYYALAHKNMKVAARLLCYFPELAVQRNFKGEFVWDDAQAAQSFVTMFVPAVAHTSL